MKPARSPGWYWVKRTSDEPWQVAQYGPVMEYPGEYRWRLSIYLEMHRGRMFRVGPRLKEPK